MLRFEGIELRYGNALVLDGVSVSFETGQIHALVGENGAGKSSLMKAAAGLVPISTGQITLGRETRAHWSVSASLRAGLRMVFQHSALVPTMTAVENVLLSRAEWGSLNIAQNRAKVEQKCAEFGLAVPLDTAVSELSVTEQQRAELLRALMTDCRVLILDEPTAVLPPAEIHALYTLLRRIANAGVVVLVVTHKISEVARYADTVTALRSGKIEGQRAVLRDEEMPDVVAWVMGQSPQHVSQGESDASTRNQVIASLHQVSAAGLRDVNLKLHSGEVVGLAGVDGSGQEPLTACLLGHLKAVQGDVRRCHVVVVREDRHADEIVLGATVMDNLLLGDLDALAVRGVLSLSAMRHQARAVLGGIAAVLAPMAVSSIASGNEAPARDTLAMRAGELSGGNQQKMVIARAVQRVRAHVAEGNPCALVVHFPTRGVDAGASLSIHAALRTLARDVGAAVLVRSADLDELRVLSDRIVVMCAGTVSGSFPAQVSDEVLGRAMLASHALPPLMRETSP